MRGTEIGRARTRGSGELKVLSFLHDQAKTFTDIVVHPTQEMLRHPAGAFFAGVRNGHISRCKSMPATVGGECRFRSIRPSDQPVESADKGIWCGPISYHLGHMVADFGMRIAGSSLLDETTPLVFSLWDDANAEPPPFFWQIIDHLAIDRSRVLLVSKPTRFGQLSVLPQAERRFAGGPSRRHLELMDAITAPPFRADQDLGYVFVSRAHWPKGGSQANPILMRH
jgi:hypothetical protein